MVFDHWSPASLAALISVLVCRLSAPSHFHSSVSTLWLWLLLSVTAFIISIYVCVCLYVCVKEEGVKEQGRESKWKGFPELRGIKVTDGFSDLSFSIFVRKLKAINSYLTAEPLVPSFESLCVTSRLLVGEWCAVCVLRVLIWLRQFLHLSRQLENPVWLWYLM